MNNLDSTALVIVNHIPKLQSQVINRSIRGSVFDIRTVVCISNSIALTVVARPVRSEDSVVPKFYDGILMTILPSTWYAASSLSTSSKSSNALT
jgi:hypothetical protein